MGRWTKMLQTARIVASDEERLAKYCPDLDRWPESWSMERWDIDYGQQLVERFKPFMLHLLDAGLSRKTLRTHRDNLWMLGGEMIGHFHCTGERLVEAWLDQVIGQDGGPLMREQISERVQESFDSTCRRFHRFCQNTPSGPQ